MTGMVSVAAMTLTPDTPMLATIGPKACTVQPRKDFDGFWHPRSHGGLAVHRRRRPCGFRRASGALGARSRRAARSLEAVLRSQCGHACVAGGDRLCARHG